GHRERGSAGATAGKPDPRVDGRARAHPPWYVRRRGALGVAGADADPSADQKPVAARRVTPAPRDVSAMVWIRSSGGPGSNVSVTQASVSCAIRANPAIVVAASIASPPVRAASHRR